MYVGNHLLVQFTHNPITGWTVMGGVGIGSFMDR